MNCRHADFQKSKWLIRFIFINQLPGRPLHGFQRFSQQCTAAPRKIHARETTCFAASDTPNRKLLGAASSNAAKFGRSQLGIQPAAELHDQLWHRINVSFGCPEIDDARTQ
jgi:hypothetical protein